MRRRVSRLSVVCAVVASTLVAATVTSGPASAFPKGDPVYSFKYKVVATTHIKRENLTITAGPGLFQGGIDLATGQLKGSISLPNTTFTQSEGGIGLVTATSATVATKPVTGTVNIATLEVTSTSTFNIHILSMYPAIPDPPKPLPPAPKVNLVGGGCVTASPISVTMSGKANLSGSSTFKGVFTIPDFVNCGVMTQVINQEIPGPGNTFTTTASSA